MLVPLAGMTQTYDQLWAETDSLMRADLPRRAIASAMKIYDKAEKEGHAAWLLKAWLAGQHLRTELNPDSTAAMRQRLKAWAGRETDTVAKSVLLSVLGTQMAEDDACALDDVSGCLHGSIQAVETLSQTPARDFRPMTETGELSVTYLNDNLYDLLVREAINALSRRSAHEEVYALYSQLLEHYDSRRDRKASFLTEEAMLWHRIESMSHIRKYALTDDEIEAKLIGLAEKYADVEGAEDAVVKLASWHYRRGDMVKTVGVAQEGMRTFKDKATVEKLQRYVDAAKRPRLEVRLPLLYPDKDVEVHVSHANLSGFTLELYSGLDVKESAMRSKDAVLRKHFKLIPRDDYQPTDTTLTIRLPQQGGYTMRQIPDGESGEGAAIANIYVTKYECVNLPVDASRRELTVVDKLTGRPASDAEIVTYSHENKEYLETGVYAVDSLGRVMLDVRSGGRLYYRVRSLGGEDFMPVETCPTYSSFREGRDEKTTEIHSLFTDRSVYRPGQTAHVSGVIYEKKGDEAWTKQGVTMTVRLMSGVKTVGQAETVTDAMGVMTCDFALPADLRPGSYVIKTDKASASIRVEEYKRPTFSVTFDDYGYIYNIGDTVTLSALAITFSGAPVRDALVKYELRRSQRSWFRSRGNADDVLLTGETVTDSGGRFSIDATLAQPEYDFGRDSYLVYTVTADVTDVAGETQTATASLPAGRQSLALHVTGLPGVLMKGDDVKLQLQALNLRGMPVDMDVPYKLMHDGKEVTSGMVRSCLPFSLPDMKAWQIGTYTFVAGEGEYLITKDFILYDRDSRSMPVDTVMWFHQDDRTLYFGSSQEVYLMVNVYDAQGRKKAERMTLNDAVRSFSFPDDEDLTVGFTFVKQGVVYVKTLRLLRPQPERTLELRWETFRDRLNPGGEQEWRLSISRRDTVSAAANLMATLYDASLDVLRPHSWKFTLRADRFAPTISVRSLRGMQSASAASSFPYLHPDSGLDVIRGDYSRLYRPIGFKPSEAVPLLYRTAVAAKGVALDAGAESYGMEDDDGEDDEQNGEGDAVRDRLNEGGTAFFFPTLRTDGNGIVTLTFTAPETLTRWKMLGFAHTQDMRYGLIEAAAQTARQLMLQPNLPRFLRVGDKAQIVASLANMTSSPLKGKAVIQLIDPETEKVVVRSSQPFEVGEGKTAALTFAFTVPDGHDMLICRILADAGDFSDGEQSLIPVLSNRETVVETVPFQIRGEGEKVIDLSGLFGSHSKTATGHRLKIQLTANPAWEVVHAISSDGIKGDDALTYATVYVIEKLKERVESAVGVAAGDNASAAALRHLQALQLSDGSWAWYKGMRGSLYVTSQIAEMMARLKSRGISLEADAERMFSRAFDYLTREAEEAYGRLPRDVQRLSPDSRLVHYAYICALTGRADSLSDSISTKLVGRSSELSIRQKAMTAVVMQSVGRDAEAATLLESLKEYALADEEMGVYFLTSKAEYSWRSYRLPSHVAAMEAISRLAPDAEMLDGMKLWLLKQKQVQGWESSIATADAVYAFVCLGDDVPELGAVMTAQTDGYGMVTPTDSAGTVTHEFIGGDARRRSLTVTRQGSGTGWGAVYAQYEEELDKTRPAEGHGLKIVRTYVADSELHVGDRVTVRLQITSDRDMDFVEVADSRPSCLEPVTRLSGYKRSGSLGYYFAVRDSETCLFIDKLRRGTYTVDYECVVDRAGSYRMAPAKISSVYSPEYCSYDVPLAPLTVTPH